MKEGGWEPLAARVRGLATHLLNAARLREIARADDLNALARALADAGATVGVAPDPVALEIAARRVVAGYVATVWRWAGDRQPELAPFLEDEDRRSVRALVRGAAAGAAPASRLASLVPTPMLPIRALDELAKQATAAEVGALLRAWKHPFGAAITAADSADLLATESAVDRLWAARAREALGHGPDVLRRALGLIVDATNAGTALVLASQHSDVDHASLFLDGGARIHAAKFDAAIAKGNRPDAGELLSLVIEPPSLAAAVSDASIGSVPLEDGVLRALIGWARVEARRDPTGPASVIEFLFRVRAQLHDLQLLAWRIALGAPRVLPHQLLVAA